MDSSKTVQRVWDKACDVFADMSAPEKSTWLRKTRAEHLAENMRLDKRNHDDVVYDTFLMRLFVRYLVWRKHVTAQEEYEVEDEQPRISEVSAFLEKSGGASLADIQHKFPDVTDVTTLVHRVSSIATYTVRKREEAVYVLGVETRSKKRAAEEELEEPAKKKMRKMKCSGRTCAKKACRNRKVVDSAAGSWNCGRHGA